MRMNFDKIHHFGHRQVYSPILVYDHNNNNNGDMTYEWKNFC